MLKKRIGESLIKNHKAGKKVKKILILSGVISLLFSSAVFAEVVEVEGGTWDYGMDGFLGGWVHSNYYHSTEIHGSSVQGVNFVSDYNVSPSEWSEANTASAISGNHAYYCIGYRSDVNMRSDNDGNGLKGVELLFK